MAQEEIWFLYGKDAAIVSYASTQDAVSGQPVKDNKQSNRPWYYFGKDNLLPDDLVKLVYDNDVKPELLAKKAAFIVGKKLRTFREVIKDGELTQEVVLDLNKDLKQYKLRKFLRRAAKQLVYFNNVYVEFILTRDRRSVSQVRVIDATKVRAEEMINGKIENYYVCGDWKNPRFSETDPDNGNVKIVPAYHEDMALEDLPEKFIMHLKDDTVGQDYYGLPDWYGTRNWLKLANKIPSWHLSGITHGYNIRYHIQIPANYFDQYKDENEKSKAKEKMKEQLNKWLSGEDNVGKSFASFFDTDATGKELPGWKITPIQADLNDEAFTKLYENSFQSVTGGGGIDPSLAGVMFPGKMGAGSGSEKRLAYQIHVLLNTTIHREVLTEAIQLIHEINGWPDDIEYGFEDFDLTTLDQLSTGQRTVLTETQNL